MQMKSNYTYFFFNIVVFISLLLNGCANESKELRTYDFNRNESLTRLLANNQEEKNYLVVILGLPSCDLCLQVQNLVIKTSGFPPNVIFRSVYVDNSENKWITQAIRDYTFPLTLIFNPDNRLVGYIKGANKTNIANGFQKAFNSKYFYYDGEIPFLNKYAISSKSPDDLKLKFLNNLIEVYAAHTNQQNLNNKKRELLIANAKSYPYFFNKYLIYLTSKDQAIRKDLLTNDTENLDQFLYASLKKEIIVNSSSPIKNNLPLITLRTDSLDFGHKKLGDSDSANIYMKNTGQSDLRLTDVGTSCGCLKVKWGQKDVIIPPMAEDSVKVAYNLKNKGKFLHKVYLFSNELGEPKEFTIKGVVH